MRSETTWRPTKYELGPRGLRASRTHVAAASRFITDLVAKRYHELLTRYASGTLLDVGCGEAPLYLAYRPLVSEVVLVDWENTLHPNPFLDVVCDLNDRIAWPSASADTVLASDVLEHLHRPASLFREAARLLRPGGRLILGTPFLYWIHEQPHDYGRHTEFALRRFCSEHSLQVELLEPYGGAWEVLVDIVGKQAASSRALAAAHRALTWALLESPAARLFVNRSPRAFPLGYVLVAKR